MATLPDICCFSYSNLREALQGLSTTITLKIEYVGIHIQPDELMMKLK